MHRSLLCAIFLIPRLAPAEATAPPLPPTINVAGADCSSAEHLKPRRVDDPSKISGLYESGSITDGRQTLRLRVHSTKRGVWLVDGSLSTTYGTEGAEVVKFTNAQLQKSSAATWCETGMPGVVLHLVTFKPPKLGVQDPDHPERPALILSDSVYHRSAAHGIAKETKAERHLKK